MYRTHSVPRANRGTRRMRFPASTTTLLEFQRTISTAAREQPSALWPEPARPARGQQGGYLVARRYASGPRDAYIQAIGLQDFNIKCLPCVLLDITVL